VKQKENKKRNAKNDKKKFEHGSSVLFRVSIVKIAVLHWRIVAEKLGMD
jgi:hypothetical protein